MNKHLSGWGETIPPPRQLKRSCLLQKFTVELIHVLLCVAEAVETPVEDVATEEQDQENVEDADGDVDMERGTKRSAPGESPVRRKKKKKLPGPPLPKNALMQLNEIKPGLVYNLLAQSGEYRFYSWVYLTVAGDSCHPPQWVVSGIIKHKWRRWSYLTWTWNFVTRHISTLENGWFLCVWIVKCHNSDLWKHSLLNFSLVCKKYICQV